MSVKALFFDVFGTLVDWRSSVAREAEAVLKPLGHALDWPAFADAWRDQYQPAMEEVRSGRAPFCKLDVLHRRNLERILPRFGISALGEDTARNLNLAWHRLDAWPDVTRGPRASSSATCWRRSPTATFRSWSISRAATVFPGTRFWARRSPATTSPMRACIWRHARRSTSRPATA